VREVAGTLIRIAKDRNLDVHTLTSHRTTLGQWRRYPQYCGL